MATEKEKNTRNRLTMSLRIQILLGFTLLFSIIFAIAFYWFYQYSTNRALDRIREDMIDTLKGTILGIDGDEFEALAKEIPPMEDGVPDEDPRYVRHQQWLEQVNEVEPRSNPYTYVPANDSDDPYKPILFVGDILRKTRPEIGTVFLESYTPFKLNMNGAYERITYDMEGYTDEWGSWVSAYGPIENSAGKVVGAVGIDFSIEYVQQVQKGIRDSIVIAFAITYSVLFVLVFIISQVLTRPIIELTKAAAQVGEGNYEQDFSKLSEAGMRNEISTLAEVFTIMVEKVHRREQTLKRQVETLRIEINATKRRSQVEEIVETDFFKDLQSKAREIRGRRDDRTEEKGE
jgi:HAMP domain-containing protein